LGGGKSQAGLAEGIDRINLDPIWAVALVVTGLATLALQVS
jgi:hypothetical protein